MLSFPMHENKISLREPALRPAFCFTVGQYVGRLTKDSTCTHKKRFKLRSYERHKINSESNYHVTFEYLTFR
jgi:hypothetical protein